MKTYVVKLAVPASRMSDILGLLERDIADVTIAIRPYEKPPRLNGEAAKLLTSGYAGDRPGIKKIVLEALAAGPLGAKELTPLIEAQGYAPMSLNRITQVLRKEKAIKLIRSGAGTRGGKWALAK